MLTSLDQKAVELLAEQGRATWADLADHLGVSPPAAADRVRKLEERGVIRGYAALVDAEQVGYGLTAFVAVTLEKPKYRDTFIAKVHETAEILECHHVAGDDDFLLKVKCRGTKHLDDLLTYVLKSIPGVARTRTTIVLSTAKEKLFTSPREVTEPRA